MDNEYGIDPNSDPLIARSWLNSGIAERAIGEMFCGATYNFGPDGGILIPGDGRYDPSVLVSSDSIFTRANTMAQNALNVGQAALAAGALTAEDWYMFDPQVIVYSAHALLAQTYMYLEEWDLAVQHAQQVPIEHVEYTHFNEETEVNELWDIIWDNDDGSVWGEVHEGKLYGVPATALWYDDPRVDVTHCGDWSGDFGGSITRKVASSAGCYDYRSESNRYPLWAPNKYDEYGSDQEIFTGVDMVLIQAEAALVGGNLPLWETHINTLRAYYGLDPLAVSDPQIYPLSAGSLEWPNAEDDAWSIMDRERYLTLWLHSRRQMDLRRWEHPFLTDQPYNALIPAHEGLYSGPRYMWCQPLPSQECNTNPQITNNAEICGVIPIPPGASG